MTCPMTDCHTHHPVPSGCEGILALTSPENVPESESFSLGVHPMSAAGPEIPPEFLPFFHSERCVAIGECGLDRRSALPLKEQEKLFRAQAALAEDLQKPLVIHAVRTRQELLRLRKSLQPTVPWILHGCRGNEARIREMADAGFVLSFGEGLLRDAGTLEGFFRDLPPDSLLLETDEAILSHEVLYAEAASLRDMNRDDFTELIFRNYRRIFFHDGK